MKTTVIIPNWNGLEFLKRCLESLKAQTTEHALIIVDNGSEDGSRDYLRSKAFRQSFPGVRCFLLPKNTGFCHAVNLGVKKAATDYVFLLNNDARLKEDCLERLEEAMEWCPGAFGVQCLMLNGEGSRIDSAGDQYCALGWAFSRARGRAYAEERGAEEPEKEPREIFSACGGASLYNRKLYLKLGGMDEAHFAYLEDVDLGYRARLFGYRNYLCPGAVCFHEGSASTGSTHNPFKVYHASRNNLYLLGKNMPLPQLALNLPLLTAGSLIKLLYFSTKGMGGEYAAGQVKGICMLLSGKGKNRKRPGFISHIPLYLGIEINLCHNIVALFSVIM